MIKKINDLKIAESFIQINFTKGYKYIDKAGEIVNEFCLKNKEPIFNMDLGGLTIYNPTQNIAEMKVSPKIYWTHFVEPDSLDLMSDVYMKNGKKILDILNINNVQRVGWRIYFVKEYNKESERDIIFDKLNYSDNVEFESGIFILKNKDYDSKIRIRKAIKNDNNRTPSIIIDIDLFKIYENGCSGDKVKSVLNDFKKELRSDFWLDEINNIINKKNQENVK